MNDLSSEELLSAYEPAYLLGAYLSSFVYRLLALRDAFMTTAALADMLPLLLLLL